MKKTGIITRLKMWFIDRDQLIKRIIVLQKMQASKIDKWIGHIEKLDQNKIYIISMPGSSQDDSIMVKNFITDIQHRLQWTMPTILVMNQEIAELDHKEIERLYKLSKKNQKESEKREKI